MSRVEADFLIENAHVLYTLADGSRPRRREALGDPAPIEGGAVAAHDGRIVAVGTTEQVRDEVQLLAGATLFDATGHGVCPGFVDPHTHAVFGAPRSWEFGRRLRGESYQSIAAAGGGIRSSVREFREIGEDELFRRSRRRLLKAMAYGTTTIEIKSGYGLDFENEMKALRVIARLAADEAMPRIVATCLAAHEFPDEWREDREGYVRHVCEEILPAVASAHLAERADVFCEPNVYTPEQTRRILEAASACGLRATVHADELEPSGGAVIAAAMGADSADHLGCIDAEGIASLAASDTVAVLLPGTIFSLGLDNWAPARSLIDRGATVALATDFNPGSNWCESIPLTMAIACTRLRLHPHEALAMVTVNASHALRRDREIGSLEVGKCFDCLILTEPTVDGLCHHLGLDPVAVVVRRGRVVHQSAHWHGA